jgi:signal transduction protein with GAF and PtsI domain
MTVDGQVVALAIRELRAMPPKTGGLLVPFQRVAEAIMTVVGVDGARLTLAHEDHQPKWVATTDAAMELLEQIQQDLAEGPCLLAYAENRVVAVEDLRTASRWDPVAVVVDQLQVRGVLSVPVRLDGQPVGTLDVYAPQPRAWSAEEVMALGAFATLTAELVHKGVELAKRDAEVAQLRQALTSRIWVEQAKGVLAATHGVTPDEGFQQLRARARAQAAEQTLQAARTGLAQRAAALDRAQDDADARERTADQCGHLADERDRAAGRDD